jgi:hypothetical protein
MEQRPSLISDGHMAWASQLCPESSEGHLFLVPGVGDLTEVRMRAETHVGEAMLSFLVQTVTFSTQHHVTPQVCVL